MIGGLFEGGLEFFFKCLCNLRSHFDGMLGIITTGWFCTVKSSHFVFEEKGPYTCFGNPYKLSVAVTVWTMWTRRTCKSPHSVSLCGLLLFSAPHPTHVQNDTSIMLITLCGHV